MRVLAFNHHGDCFRYMFYGFESIGVRVDLAGWGLADNVCFPRFHANSMPVSGSWEGFPVVGVDGGYDYYLSILPEVGVGFGERGWFDCRLQAHYGLGGLCGVRSINDVSAGGFHFCGNWVPFQGVLRERRCVVQLINYPWLGCAAETRELLALRRVLGGGRVVIAGYDAPDGFVDDRVVLPCAALLVHNKRSGVSCYAVCKALDYGVPVYMDRSTKALIGFGDLPDELFIFRDDYNLLEAYRIALGLDSGRIRDVYRSIYSLKRLGGCLSDILNRVRVGVKRDDFGVL